MFYNNVNINFDYEPYLDTKQNIKNHIYKIEDISTQPNDFATGRYDIIKKKVY